MGRIAVVVSVVLALAGCGRKKVAAAPNATLAATPVTASLRVPVASHATEPLEAARRAEHAGRTTEALDAYEALAVAADPHTRLQARLAAARYRLAIDPATRDLRKAQLLLEGAEPSAPTAALELRVSDVLHVLRESADLRAQLRTIRAEVKALEAEIAKKDEALRRVTSAVVGGRTP
jgi:hypothetical protein